MTIRHRARLMTASALSLTIAFSPLAAELATAQTANAVLQPDPAWEKEFAAWRAASKAGTVAQYEAYLKAYPKGKFATVAKTRITQLTAKADQPAATDDTAKVDAAPATDNKVAEDTAKVEETAPAEDAAETTADASQPAAQNNEPAKVKVAPQAADPALAGVPRQDTAKTEEADVAADNPDKAEVTIDEAWQKEYDLWLAAVKGKSVNGFEDYLKAYPEGKFASLAKGQVEQLQAAVPADANDVAVGDPLPDDVQMPAQNKVGETAQAEPDSAWEQEYALWKAAAQGNTVTEYNAYLKVYPDGKFATIAKSRVEALSAAEKTDPSVAEGDEQPADDSAANKTKVKNPPADQAQVDEQQPEDDGTVAEDPQAATEDDAGEPAEAQDNTRQSDQEQVALTEGTPDTEDEAIDEGGHIEMQGRLTSMGYDTAGLDGIFGRRTRDAIANWQQDNGAPVSGYLSMDQVDLIREQSEPNYADWLKSAAAATMVIRPQRVIRDEPVVIQRVKPRVVIRERVHVKPRVVIRQRVGKTCFVNRKGRFVCRRF